MSSGPLRNEEEDPSSTGGSKSSKNVQAVPSVDPPPEEGVPETPPLSAPPTLGPNPQSKRALKRLRKREEWLQSKGERRKVEKEKRKRKLDKLRESGVHTESLSKSRKKLKDVTMEGSACKVGVIVDMSFDDCMNQKDLGKCCKQLQHCYCVNRRMAHPMQFHLTSFAGKCETEMNKNDGFRNWDVKFHKEPFYDVFQRDQLVYLTSESDRVLDKLEDDKFYVIGGLVDHNLHKGISHKLATDHSIPTARLPIDKFMAMKTRKVLTVDHVFRILGSITEGKTWQEALTGVIPPRKGAIVIKNDDAKENAVKKEEENKNDDAKENAVEKEQDKNEDVKKNVVKIKEGEKDKDISDPSGDSLESQNKKKQEEEAKKEAA